MRSTDVQGAGTVDARRPGRRAFLKAIAIGLPAAMVASAVPTTLLTLRPGRDRGSLLESAKASTFSGHMGEKFSISTGAFDPVDVELREVTDLRGTPAGHAFSIVFRGSRDAPLGQDTYRFEHEELGQFPLFIVPLAERDDGSYYEAIINRV